MPLARPTAAAPPPAADTITTARADVTGMEPGTAHEAILGALDAGIIAATAAAGMIDQAVIDATVAQLADTRGTIAAHGPYQIDDTWWCFAEGQDGPPWPCPTYRAAADTIADGLGR